LSCCPLPFLQEKYAQENILGRLPANFQSLTEVSREAGSLIDEPDLDQFVFCRVKQDVGLVSRLHEWKGRIRRRAEWGVC
jgi:hypothetical protein